MADYYPKYHQLWLKAHKSILSNRYNKPKKYSGSEKFVDGKFILHTHLKENSRRLQQLIREANKNNETIHIGARLS